MFSHLDLDTQRYGFKKCKENDLFIFYPFIFRLPPSLIFEDKYVLTNNKQKKNGDAALPKRAHI